MPAEAFAEDQFGMGDREPGMEGCAFGVLKGVFGPEGLGAVGGLDDFEWLPGMSSGEGDVCRGVPVLGEDDVIKFLGQGVDDGDYGVSVRDGQGSAGHEVVLDVDDEEGVCGLKYVHRCFDGIASDKECGRALRDTPTFAGSGALRMWHPVSMPGEGYFVLGLMLLWMVPILMSGGLQASSMQKPVIQISPLPNMAPW